MDTMAVETVFSFWGENESFLTSMKEISILLGRNGVVLLLYGDSKVC